MRRGIAILICASVGLVFARDTALATDAAVSVNWVDASAFPTMRASVSVPGAGGAPMHGLAPGAFSVSEDGKNVAASVTEELDPRTPIALVLGVDTSGSMAGNGGIGALQNGLPGVIDGLAGPDMVAVVNFANTVSGGDWSADKARTKAMIGELRAAGDTALFDAAVRTLRVANAAPLTNRAVILLTDGQDSGNVSAFSRDAALREASGAGVPVYTIGLGDDADTGFLDQLSGLTGGQTTRVSAAPDLGIALRRATDDIRRAYVVSWRSGLPADRSEHSLSVKVIAPGGGEVRADRKFRTTSVPPVPKVESLEGRAAARVTSAVTIETTVESQGPIASVAYRLDGTPTFTASVAPYRYVLNTSTMPRGRHTLDVTATDTNGNVGVRSYAFTVGGTGFNPAWLALAIGAAATLAVVLGVSSRRRSRGDRTR